MEGTGAIEILNNDKFIEIKRQTIKIIQNIHSQISEEIYSVLEEIPSEKLTTHLSVTMDLLKEIKEHQRDKIIMRATYN